MLFLTIYGPELESLYRYIDKYTQHEGSVSRERIYSTYLPQTTPAPKGQTKNIEDALSYLKAARLVEGEKEFRCVQPDGNKSMPFAMLLLGQFRRFKEISLQLPLIDVLYVTLLDELYIAPNRVWIRDLHAAANKLELAQQIGGISQEKIDAWKRVMEFLGIGYRIGGGFYCLYGSDLLRTIASQWSMREGTLQTFFEEYLQTWVPCLTARGDVARPVASVLAYLAQQGNISLYPKQDSSSRPYFGSHQYRGIKIV